MPADYSDTAQGKRFNCLSGKKSNGWKFFERIQLDAVKIIRASMYGPRVLSFDACGGLV